MPEDPNSIVLEPRIDIDSVVELNSYVLSEEDEEESIEWVNLISESDSEGKGSLMMLIKILMTLMTFNF